MQIINSITYSYHNIIWYQSQSIGSLKNLPKYHQAKFEPLQTLLPSSVYSKNSNPNKKSIEPCQEMKPTDKDRSYSLTNIKAQITVILDLEEMNYTQWKTFLEMHCITKKVDGYLHSTTLPKGKVDKTWLKKDTLV